MTTTELYSGLNEGKPSSRVLNPPGGRSNNIFGSDEPPAPVQQKEMAQGNENQNSGSAAATPPAPTATAEQHEIYNRNRPKKQDVAPYASFTDSDRHSPFERNGMSQNGNDFRCHSITAYRNAVVLNAEIRQKARGQASAFNPITHEDYPNDEEPDHDLNMAPTPQRSHVQVESEKDFGRRDKARASDFNLITHQGGQNEQANQKTKSQSRVKFEKDEASDFNLITHQGGKNDQANQKTKAQSRVKFEKDEAQAYNPITGEEIPASRAQGNRY